MPADIESQPSRAGFLSDHLPHGVLAMLAGAGHVLPIEAPERVAAAIEPFRSMLP
jgi:hypothetical protein